MCNSKVTRYMLTDFLEISELHDCKIRFHPRGSSEMQLNCFNGSYEGSMDIFNDVLYDVLVKGKIEEGEKLEIIAPSLVGSLEHLKKLCQKVFDKFSTAASTFKKDIYNRYKGGKLTAKIFSKLYNSYYYNFIEFKKHFWTAFKKCIYNSNKKDLLVIFFDQTYYYYVVREVFKKDGKIKNYYEVLTDIMENCTDSSQKDDIINIVRISNRINRFVSSVNPENKTRLFDFETLSKQLKVSIHENILDMFVQEINDLIIKATTNSGNISYADKKLIVNKLQYLCYFCTNQQNNIYFVHKYKDKLKERLLTLKTNYDLEAGILETNGFCGLGDDYVDMILMINDFISSDFMNSNFNNPEKNSSVIEIPPEQHDKLSGAEWRKTKVFQMNYHSFGYLEKEHYVEKINLPEELDLSIKYALKFANLDWDSFDNNCSKPISLRHNNLYRLQKIIYDMSTVPLTISLNDGDYEIVMTLLQAAVYIYINKNKGKMNWKDIVKKMNVDENVIFPHMLSLALVGIIRERNGVLSINKDWKHSRKTCVDITHLVKEAKAIVEKKRIEEESAKKRIQDELVNDCISDVLLILREQAKNKIMVENIIEFVASKNKHEYPVGDKLKELVVTSIELLVKDGLINVEIDDEKIYYKIKEDSDDESESDSDSDLDSLFSNDNEEEQ